MGSRFLYLPIAELFKRGVYFLEFNDGKPQGVYTQDLGFQGFGSRFLVSRYQNLQLGSRSRRTFYIRHQQLLAWSGRPHPLSPRTNAVRSVSACPTHSLISMFEAPPCCRIYWQSSPTLRYMVSHLKTRRLYATALRYICGTYITTYRYLIGVVVVPGSRGLATASSWTH